MGEDKGEGGREALSLSGQAHQQSLLCVIVVLWPSHMKEEGEDEALLSLLHCCCSI